MGNFQERIRQIQEGKIRTQAQRTLYEEASRRESAKSAEREKKDAIDETNLLREEFFPLMERFGARELLQQVRDEVWRVGKIDPEPRLNGFYSGGYHDSCSLGLSFDYETAYEDIYTETIGDGARDAQGTRTSSLGWKRRIARTTLEIIIKRTLALPDKVSYGRSRSLNQSERLQYRQSFQGKPYGHNWELSLNERYGFEARDFDPVNPENSRIKLEEFILKDCVERTEGNRLPLQLKEQGEMEISKHFPIQSFLKRFLVEKSKLPYVYSIDCTIE